MNCTRRSVLLSCLNAYAATRSLDTPPDEWFQTHDLKNRWEGLYGENQGSPVWELRSFVAGNIEYPREKNTDLQIQYYVPDSRAAFIKAQVISRNPSYLMEPKQETLTSSAGWRYFKGWSTQAVLVPKKISSHDLGVLIRLGADDETVNTFAPAIVFSSNSPLSISRYRFDFFTAKALRDFTFDVFGANGYRQTYRNRPGAPDRGNLVVEFDATKIPEGPSRVLLNPQYETSQNALTLDWRFYHHPLR